MCRLLVVAFCLGLCSCNKPEPPAQVLTTGSTQHKIPGDPTILQATFAEAGGKHQYIVLAYGREKEIQAKQDHIVVDGKRVAVAGTDKVYVLDPQLKLHESGVKPADLQAPLWAGGADEYFKSDPWQRDLYPLLKKHRWGGEQK